MDSGRPEMPGHRFGEALLRHLRRRATIARKGLDQVLETAAELGLADPTWGKLGAEGRALAQALKQVESLDEMELGVSSLERRQREARERLETATSQPVDNPSEAVDSDPMGSENRPHQYNYKPNLNLEEDTVMAFREGSSVGEAGVTAPEPVPMATQAKTQEKPATKPPRTDSGPVLRLTTDELVRLAPRLKPYLLTPSPTWPDIIEAADWLRHDLGVSQPLWGDACLAMGREQAAIALAIVSAKPAGHFTSTPGGYFSGMVARAKAGTLNLARTIWGLRDRKETNGYRKAH